MKRLALLFCLLGAAVGQTNSARMLSGVNAQTGTTYTFVQADATRLVTFNNANPIAASLPSGLAFGFGAGSLFSVKNVGTGTLTITCSGCTITSTGSPASTLVLTIGQGADIYSDGVNYSSQSGNGAGGSGTPGGSNTQIQFNNSNAFSGDPNLTWVTGSAALKVIGINNFVDSADTGNISPGKINGVTIAAFNAATSPSAAAGGTQLDTASTTTAFATSSDFYTAQSAGLQVNPSADYAGGFGPFYVGASFGALVPSSNTHKISDVIGVKGVADFAGSGNLNNALIGGRFDATKAGTGGFNGVLGISANVNINAAGTVTQSNGVNVNMSLNSGTVTTNAGVFVLQCCGPGTATHNYGILIQDQALNPGTNPDPHGIVVQGSAPSDFGTGVTTVGKIGTNTNCSATGTAANPSVASCANASAGSFSCATNASGGTCTVNTTAVTANSEIFITQRTDTTTGTRLSVTCNTGISTVLPVITAVTAATSFTINLGTITTNPECFSYYIVN